MSRTKGAIRFLGNVLLDVVFSDDGIEDSVAIQVPFSSGAWYPIQYVESDGSLFYNLIFPDGSTASGINKKLFEINKSTTVNIIETEVEEQQEEEIQVSETFVETALFDGLSLGAKQ